MVHEVIILWIKIHFIDELTMCWSTYPSRLWSRGIVPERKSWRDWQFTRWAILIIDVGRLAPPSSLSERIGPRVGHYCWLSKPVTDKNTFGSRVHNVLLDLPLPSLIKRYRSQDGKFTRWTSLIIDVARPPSLCLREDRSTSFPFGLTKWTSYG